MRAFCEPSGSATPGSRTIGRRSTVKSGESTSVEKCRICWRTLFSSTVKSACVRSVTGRPLRSVTTNRILINRGPECQIHLLGDAWVAPHRIAFFHLENGANDLRIRTFWTWLTPLLRRKQQPYFLLTSTRCKFNRVDGLSAIAVRTRRAGLMKSEHNQPSGHQAIPTV